MPGIRISTAVRTGPTTDTVRESSQAFFVGKALRGPTDRAVLIGSMEEYESHYGGYVSWSYLHPTVQTFFEEGGTQCWISRVVGTGATEGSLTLDDSAAADALTFTAVGEGDWSTAIEVAVVAGGASGTVNVQLYADDILVFATGDCSTNDQIVGKFARNATASRLVSVSNDGGDLVAVAASTPLSAGDDQRAAIVTQDYVDGLGLFLDSYGTGSVSCPETAAVAMYQGLLDHANNNSRIALLHTDAGVTDPTTFARTITATEGNTEHGGLFWPWVYAPTGTLGVNRLIPPVGYVAACRARVHNQTGAHVPYAGLVSSARFVNGLEQDVAKQTADALDAVRVNVIRTIANSIRVYGARTLTSDEENFRYLTAQEVVNSIVVDSYRSLEDLVFSTIDGRNTVFASIEAKLIGVLEPMRVAGALYEAFDAQGARIDYGYTVKCDSSLNPVTQLADGLIRAKVGVRVSSVGDRIEVDIVKSNLTNSVV